MRTGVRRTVASGLLVAALALAGCGGGEEEPESPPLGTEVATGAAEDPATAAPESTGAPASDPAADAGDASPAPEGDGGQTVYVVESGDNLTSIAEEFGTTVEAIVEANDIADPNVIVVGEELTIPGS